MLFQPCLLMVLLRWGPQLPREQASFSHASCQPLSMSVRFRMPSHAPPVLTFQFHFLGFLNRKHDIIMQELQLHRKVWTTCFGKSRGRFLCVFSLVLFGLYSVRSLTLCFGVNRYRLFLREVIAIQPLIILKPDLKSSRRVAQEFLAT
jgi:hypothetical protein